MATREQVAAHVLRQSGHELTPDEIPDLKQLIVDKIKDGVRDETGKEITEEEIWEICRHPDLAPKTDEEAKKRLSHPSVCLQKCRLVYYDSARSYGATIEQAFRLAMNDLHDEETFAKFMEEMARDEGAE